MTVQDRPLLLREERQKESRIFSIAYAYRLDLASQEFERSLANDMCNNRARSGLSLRCLLMLVMPAVNHDRQLRIAAASSRREASCCTCRPSGPQAMRIWHDPRCQIRLAAPCP